MISSNQEKFIEAYLVNSNISKISKELNLSRPTIYSYLNNDEVKSELLRRKKEVMEETNSFLRNNLLGASEELVNIIKDFMTSDSTKIQAINSLFNISRKLTETIDIEERIEKIEAKIKE